MTSEADDIYGSARRGGREYQQARAVALGTGHVRRDTYWIYTEIDGASNNIKICKTPISSLSQLDVS